MRVIAYSVRIFYLSVGLLLLASCQTRGTSSDKVNRVVALNLPLERLALIPSNYEVFYVYPTWRDYIIQNHLSKRKPLSTKSKYTCYLTDDSDPKAVLKETKACIEKFELTEGKIGYLINKEDEPSVQLGGKIRSHFNMESGLNAEKALIFSDKLVMKDYLIKNDPSIKTAKYIRIKKNDVKGEFHDFIKQKLEDSFGDSWTKLVFKPSSADSSQGISIIENDSTFEDKMKAAYLKDYRDILEDGEIIIEEFIDGKILRVDGYVRDGKLVYNFTSEYTIPPKRFYSTGDPQLTLHKWAPADRKKYDDFTQKVVTALKYKRGIIHLEVIEPAGSKEIYFLEIAARTGGTLYPVLKELGYDSHVAFVNSSLDLDYTTRIKNLTFATTALYVPKDIPKDTTKLWLEDFTHQDVHFLHTHRADISTNESEPHSYVAPEELIQISVFVGKDPQTVVKEASDYYRSLKAKVKLKGGYKDGTWYQLVNQSWKEINRQ